MSDFILGGSEITAYGDYSHEMKRCLLFRREVKTNLDSILKTRDTTLSTKLHLIKRLLNSLFGHLMWRADSFEKTLMLGKIEGGRRRARQRMRWLDGISDSMT